MKLYKTSCLNIKYILEKKKLSRAKEQTKKGAGELRSMILLRYYLVMDINVVFLHNTNIHTKDDVKHFQDAYANIV